VIPIVQRCVSPVAGDSLGGVSQGENPSASSGRSSSRLSGETRGVRERPRHAPADRRPDCRTVVMTRRSREGKADVAREVAPDVFCLGPWGRTQTVVYFVRSGSS
jgi:hypothetical protein